MVANYASPLVHTTGVNLLVPQLTVAYGPNDSNGCIFYPTNAKIECGSLDWDLLGNSANTPRIVRQKGEGGVTIIDKARVRNSVTRFYVGDLGNQATAKVIVKEVLTDCEAVRTSQGTSFDLFTNRVIGAIGLGYVKLLNNEFTPPEFINYNSTVAGDKTITWLGHLAPHIYLLPTNNHTATVNISSLSPPAFDGQKLTINTRTTAFGYILKSTAVNVLIPADIPCPPGVAVNLVGVGGVWIAG